MQSNNPQTWKVLYTFQDRKGVRQSVPLNICQWKPTTFDCFHVSFLSDSRCLSTPTPWQTLRVELSRSRFEASQELLCFQMPSCPFLSIDRRCTDRYSVQPLTISFFVLLWSSLYLLFLLVPSVFVSVSSIHSWSRVSFWACASWKVIVLVVFLASLRKKRLLFWRRPSRCDQVGDEVLD